MYDNAPPGLVVSGGSDLSCAGNYSSLGSGLTRSSSGCSGSEFHQSNMDSFFRLEHLMLILAHGYSFEVVVWSRNAFPGCPT